MNQKQRRDLADLLARMVADGEITEEQAIAIYQSVASDGSLLDNALPLPPYDGIMVPAAERDSTGIWVIVAVAAGLAPGRVDVASYIDAMPQYQRMDAADRLQDWHTDSAQRLARDLAAGRLSVAMFQRSMLALNDLHNAAHVALGSGSSYTRAATALTQQAITQAAYLQRFADVAGLRMLQAAIGQGQAMTAAQIAERAALYGGVGRALFFQTLDQYRQTDTGAGWIVRYVARDDDRTCTPCHNAQGDYLPGTGPYPGTVCLGRHRCRCRRVAIFDPARYAQLVGLPAPVAA